MNIKELNEQGLIPGPDESEDEFFKRAKYCLALQEDLHRKLDVPFCKGGSTPTTCIEEALSKTAKLYGISPRWVPVFFSNYQLTPWHGGCAWIFQIDEDSPKAALLQLRQAFYHSKKYLKIYDRDELIAHEMSHIGRMAFDEPIFEEFFAFRSSPSRFRQWFGPIIKSSWESMLFVIVLMMVFLLDLSLLSIGHFEGYQIALWAKTVPLAMIAFALGRLYWRHSQFSKTDRNLLQLVRNQEIVNMILYRLTDKEIISFSKMTPDETAECIKDNISPRGKIIKAYLNVNST